MNANNHGFALREMGNREWGMRVATLQNVQSPQEMTSVHRVNRKRDSLSDQLPSNATTKLVSCGLRC